MELLQNILKDVISRLKDELLLFAIAIIVLILIFPAHRFIIAGLAVIFAIIYTIGKIKTFKPHSENPDFISSEDWPVVKGSILQNLENDLQKLDSLIPLLKDESHKNSIDSRYKIDSPLEPLQDRISHLYSSARSKIDNKEEINMISNWLKKRNEVNQRLHMISRVVYIEENETSLKETLSCLIEFYKKC